MFSTSCKTAWAFVQFDKKLPKGYTADAFVRRNKDNKSFLCSEKGGNGKVKPGQSTCYSAMVYDKNPYKSSAAVNVWGKDGILVGSAFTKEY
jgi:hypothetical protein